MLTVDVISPLSQHYWTVLTNETQIAKSYEAPPATRSQNIFPSDAICLVKLIRFMIHIPHLAIRLLQIQFIKINTEI